ncbi:PHP domain-containing protein [Microbacterium hominis]|uniref:PHP domain-containing protein n=1 Tax=Microbacterium TaxID=33882 RepID=UPI0007686F0B|nr:MULTISPECIES: PHP domain-containing protein [Microbacterium]KXC05482.1 metal-dependent phosphoesterase [Microbacterium hominis]QOC25226.1 PHP domain-containing protein [Microbacterium hominis]QRY40774.1 PHP domain-containing protein [Microbacterium hominis]QYF98545.1 PHP domain-containing protein [Microbacterium sp. PAMC21962]
MVVSQGEHRALRFRGPSDLHLHSDHSDGTEPPARVMAAAHAAGLHTVALTDHDTTSGWTEAAEAAGSLGMTFLPGMELSARHEWRSIHVLAYLFDPEHPGLRALTDRIRHSRLTRAQTMAERIGRDYELTWDDIVAQTAVGATVGRPHLADALVARGYVRDRGEAFAGILHPGSDYYVDLYAPDPVTAVATVVDAGGVPVIAHPAGRGGLLPEPLMDRMLAAGLAGFELGHRENREPALGALRELAQRRNLLVTGSSDYHGLGKPNQPGEFTTDDDVVARIIAAARGSDPVFP